MNSLLSLLLLAIGGINAQGTLPPQPTYAVVTPTKIRPNQDVVVAATILKLELSDTFTVRAVVRRLLSDKQSEEICGAQHTFTRTGFKNLILKTPPSMTAGNYTIRVSGFSDNTLEGLIFTNETKIFFDSKQISMFIQTSKPYYNQKQTVRMRLIPLQPNAMPVTMMMDVSIQDGGGTTVREWIAQHTNAGGVVTLQYPLNSNFLAYGTWTISALCLGITYTKKFEVIEFYGPLFFVNVSVPIYTLKNSFELPVLITSTQGTLYKVKGNATVQLDFLQLDGKPIPEIESIKREINQFEHRSSIAFRTDLLMAHIGGGESGLINKQLKVTAWVRDSFFGTVAAGFASTIVYDDDIILSFLGGEVWSFKPGIPFKIYVAAQMRDMSAMDPYIEDRDIVLTVTQREAEDSIESTVTKTVSIPRDTSVVEYWLRPTTKTEQISVRARFARGQIDSEKMLVATKHWSPNDHYIHISTTTTRPAVGHYIIFNVQTNAVVDQVHYYIVSAGNIVVSDSVQMYSRNKLFSVAVSREMSPSAKIVAFYIAPDGQVAADSLQFHVDGTKLHVMNVRFNRGKDFNYDTIEITARADPLSYVAFSALEYQMYHLGVRNGLSWEEVNRELYSYGDHTNTSITHYFKRDGQLVDTFRASTPSYAHDANSTFYFAGLYIFTDANISAVFTTCNLTKGEYPCMDGKSCYNHQQICDGAATCIRDHRDEMGCHLNETTDAVLFDDGGWDRTKHIGGFYRDGAFMWKDQFTKPDGRIDISIKPPPFDVSWVVSGFAMSRQSGLSILSGLHLFDSGRPMYIHVHGARSVRLGEILSLRVTVFNLWSEQMDVLLSITGSKDYKFVEVYRDDLTRAPESVDGEQQILVPVYARSEKQIYVPIEPLTTGTVAIPVKAMCFAAGHSVTHKVSVGHNGIPDRNITNYQVDLRIANSETLPDLWLPVEEEAAVFEQRLIHYIPGSPTSYINVIGDIVGVSFFPYTKFDLSTMNMIGQPTGSGAEAIFNFAVKVHTMSMVRSIAPIAPSKITQIVANINLAIQELYAYRKNDGSINDGSFREFDWSFNPSTWVSATALQVMADAVNAKDLSSDFGLPRQTLNTTANWLVAQQDKSGRFTESDVVYNRRFESHVDIEIGGVTQPANLALTALCVTSLSHASTATSLSNNVVRGITSGAEFLSRHYQKITDPFELAIVTYALFTSGLGKQTQNALILLKSMRKEVGTMSYWSTEDIPPMTKSSDTQDTVSRILPKATFSVTAYAVSTTSYALLTYLENRESFEETNRIQRFLQEQHMWVGGFSSSQDTLVAMRALRALADKDQDRQTYDMTFTFKSDQKPGWSKSVHIGRDNWLELHRFETPSHWGSIQTKVQGHGVALVQLETTQNFENFDQIDPPPIKDVFTLGNFQRGITMRGFNNSIIDYKICPRWNGIPKQSGMSVLEVSLPSGYHAGVWAIQKYVKANMGQTSVRQAEFDAGNGVVRFYYEYLNKSDVNCAAFTIYRWFPVSRMAELTAIKVYEYYEPGNYYNGYYEKNNLLKLTVCLVCGSYQCPFCPLYNTAPTSTLNIYVLLAQILAMSLANRWM